MQLSEAIIKYDSHLREDVKLSYKEPDKYIYVNEKDEDLQKWRVEMPECPDWARLVNFGKHARDQVFVYEEIPNRLLSLKDEVEREVKRTKLSRDTDMSMQRRVHQELWEALRKQRLDYKQEINWIRSQWYYRLYGKWMMIHGKPVFIDGWQWFFLNYWPLEGTGKLPEYRTRDMKWFHAQRYAHNCTETVDYDEVINKNGKLKLKLVFLEDGTLRMKNVGYRTMFGTNNLKGRRVGETSKTCSINYCIGTEGKDRICGIQGNSESTGSDIYEEKLVYSYNRMPFFFVPEFPNLYTTSGLSFTGYNGRSGLNSKIGYATTARKEYYDQRRLDFYHGDEIGKTKLENILDRHGVVKRCCTEGAIIKGLMIYTSTAEDMEAESGQLFEQLSDDSMFEERLANGQTKSGLANVYFPIHEGYFGFIDKWGDAITGEVREDQVPYMTVVKRNKEGVIMGAEEYLESIEKDLADRGALRELAQHQRQNPKRFRECFALAMAGNNFNTTILNARINELKFQRDKKVIQGNYKWEGEAFKSKIIFVEDADGRWEVSKQLPIPQTNQTIVYDGVNRMPRFDSGFIISADAYRFDETDGYRESKGSIAVYEMYNETIDGEKNDARDNKSERFVATYLYREKTKELFAEEVLKAALYWNGLVYPEINVAIVQEFFFRYDYRGYLHFDVDEFGIKKKNSGFNTAGPVIKQRMFTYVDTWINLHAHKSEHRGMLEECLLIRGPKSTKDFDLFIAMAGCLLGASSKYTEFIRKFGSTDGVEVGGFWGLGN